MENKSKNNSSNKHNVSKKITHVLDPLWNDIQSHGYKIKEKLGEGSYGVVHKAKCINTGKYFAIKLIKDPFESAYTARQLYREIKIMRKLEEIESNIFTSQIVDIIIPGCTLAKFSDTKANEEKECTDAKDIQSRKTTTNSEDKFSSKNSDDQVKQNMNSKVSDPCSDGSEKLDTLMIKLENFNHLFLVMELGELDLKNLMNTVPNTVLEDEHITTILYNMLCAVNFIHSANIIHRDIKPSNLLINNQCNIQICDFGLSRALPKQSNVKKTLESYRKQQYKHVLEAEYLPDRVSRQKEFQNNMSKYLSKTHKEREKDNKKRDLSEVCQSRWFRAPEVALILPDYNKSIDIWSLGCILGEMMSCTIPYVKQKGYRMKNRLLFQGGSCYPLSPHKEEGQAKEDLCIEENDLIFKICEQIKINQEHDLTFLTDQNQKNYMESILNENKFKMSLKEKFPHSSNELINMLEQMLQFNPYYRPTAKELLKSKIFDKIRCEDLEKSAPFKILIDIDQQPEPEEDSATEFIESVQSKVALQLLKLYKNKDIKYIKVI